MLRELENLSFQSINHACRLKFQIANVHKTNNKKQPPEVSYKKAVLKSLSIFAGNTCVEVFFTQNARLQLQGVIKKKFRHRYFSVNIAKLLKTPILRKSVNDCFWIMRLFIHENCKIIVKCFLTFVRKYLYQSVLFNKCKRSLQLKLSLFKKRFLRSYFLDSYPKFLTTTFLV